MAPIFALGPSQGGPKEPEEPILSHLGRIPFWTLILDPQNHQKCSISKVPEPRKLHSRLDGSSIFTFSQVSYPNPKIIDFGSSFRSLLAPIWPPGPLLKLPVATLELKISLFFETPFRLLFFCDLEADFTPKYPPEWLLNPYRPQA